MKCVACKDMGVDCPYVAKGETIEDVMQKGKEHAMSEHKEWWNETGSKMSEQEMKDMTMNFAKDC